MKLYEVLAAEYSKLFPASREKINFIESLFPKKEQLNILEICCASGELVYHPFLSRDLEDVAEQTGFSSTRILGGWDGKKADPTDFFHVLVLEK